MLFSLCNDIFDAKHSNLDAVVLFMNVASRRTQKPQIPLPFHPRAAGVNHFCNAGLHVDLPGIDAVEVCTVSRGVCRIAQADREVVLSAGQSLYKLPGEHRRKTVLSPDGADIYWATFDGPGAVEFMKSYGYPEGPLETGSCLEELYMEIMENLAVCTDESFRRLTALFVDLIARLPGGDQKNDPEKQLFARCLHLISTRYNDPAFNVDTMSEMMQMHRTTLLRLFRRKQNTTPREYLTRYRIGQSLYLLETTLLTVAEIAESSGFSRCNYFCQVIRKFCGKTPEQYRREKNKGRSAVEAGSGPERSYRKWKQS